MKTNRLLIIFALAFSITAISFAQPFSQEIGVTTGPVAFKADYGLRNDAETNFGNIGLGVALAHYINFSYRADCNCYAASNYFNEHFKIRTDIMYHTTTLNHFGRFAEANDLPGLQLRSMEGKAKVFEIGPKLEWHIFNIVDYDGGSFNFSPYVSAGAHFVSFSPEATTSLPGNLGEFSNTYPKFYNPDDPYIDTSGGTTFAFVFSAGSRYRLSPVSDLVLDARWHYYGSDFVDGLDHDNPENKANDWIFWLNVGYIYYLN